MIYNVVIPLTAFGLCLILAGLVLSRGFRNSSHRLFATFLTGLALWGFFAFAMRTSPGPEQAKIWQQALTFSVMLSSITFLHFSYLYTRRRPINWLLVAGYLELVLLIILYITNASLVVKGIGIDSYGYYPIPGPFTYLVSISMYTFFILGLVNFIRSYRSSDSYDEKNSYLYIIVGVGCFLLGGLTDLASITGQPIPPVAMIGNLFFGVLASVAILRYHLLDIHLVIRRGISYLAVSTVIAIPYTMIIIFMEEYLSRDITSPWQHFFLIVLLAVLLQPAWRWTQRTVDKLFYRGNYDYLQALFRFGREAQSITDIHLLGSTLVELISKALRISGGCLLLPSSSEEYYQLASCYGFNPPDDRDSIRLAKHSPLIRWIESHDEPVFRKELEIFSPLLALPQSEKEALEKIKAEIMIPVKTREKDLVGILVLTPKLSQQLYSKQDIQFITAVASQTAMSLENARLYQELKNSYDKLMSTQEHLVKSEKLRAIGQMASGIAHDFNNALTGILGRAQLALEEKNVADTRRHLQIIEKASLDAAQVVRRLQDFARVRTDQVYGSVDLGDVVRGAIDIIQPRLRQRRDTENAAVRVVIDVGQTSRIRGSESELKEALVNLLNNALEAMPGKGRLWVKVKQEKEFAIISVSDTGMGMPVEVQDKVFDPFFTTKGSRGLGMGLSVAHSIVQRHGGDISISSKPWSGSTFSIKLPVRPADEEAVVMQESPLNNPRGQSILIIDDDERARNVLSETLSRSGYMVDTAQNGEAGLEAFREKPYDLVITDLGMPDISGQDVAQAIKHINPVIPVMLITGWGTQIDARETGVDGIITKPFEKNGILLQLERLLTGREQRMETA